MNEHKVTLVKIVKQKNLPKKTHILSKCFKFLSRAINYLKLICLSICFSMNLVMIMKSFGRESNTNSPKMTINFIKLPKLRTNIWVNFDYRGSVYRNISIYLNENKRYDGFCKAIITE